jgi:hypothetical protein
VLKFLIVLTAIASISDSIAVASYAGQCQADFLPAPPVPRTVQTAVPNACQAVIPNACEPILGVQVEMGLFGRLRDFRAKHRERRNIQRSS